MISDEALDLLSKMLVYDKNLRINCKDAMAHPYFDPVREFLSRQKDGLI
jgi:casein kinase II subunit alpha